MGVFFEWSGAGVVVVVRCIRRWGRHCSLLVNRHTNQPRWDGYHISFTINTSSSTFFGFLFPGFSVKIPIQLLMQCIIYNYIWSIYTNGPIQWCTMMYVTLLFRAKVAALDFKILLLKSGNLESWTKSYWNSYIVGLALRMCLNTKPIWENWWIIHS